MTRHAKERVKTLAERRFGSRPYKIDVLKKIKTYSTETCGLTDERDLARLRFRDQPDQTGYFVHDYFYKKENDG
jgi:hypothetical protein